VACCIISSSLFRRTSLLSSSTFFTLTAVWRRFLVPISSILVGRTFPPEATDILCRRLFFDVVFVDELFLDVGKFSFGKYGEGLPVDREGGFEGPVLVMPLVEELLFELVPELKVPEVGGCESRLTYNLCQGPEFD